jgi:hypothetical protein
MKDNMPGLAVMGSALALMAALVAIAWAEADLKEMQLPKPVLAITSVTV